MQKWYSSLIAWKTVTKENIDQASSKEFVLFPVVMGAFLDISKNLFLNTLKTSIHLATPEYLILGGKSQFTLVLIGIESYNDKYILLYTTNLPTKGK